MNRYRAALLSGVAVLGAALVVYGAVIIANSVPVEVRTVVYTGGWGVLPFGIGLAILSVSAIVAWDNMN